MSTEKRKFILSATTLFIAAHHAKPDIETAITYAEAAWAKLCARGYGPTQKKGEKTRASVNYYEKLSQHQQKWFCLFWKNFKHPHGKQRAAKSWTALGELDDAQYKQICDSALTESHRQIPAGQTRPMAELWLNERRFEDSATTSKTRANSDNKKAQLIQEARQSIVHYEGLYKQTNDADYLPIIEQAKNKLTEVSK